MATRILRKVIIFPYVYISFIEPGGKLFQLQCGGFVQPHVDIHRPIRSDDVLQDLAVLRDLVDDWLECCPV